ncbi:hypothetical protein D3C84_799340 [compost metagenome]
MLFDLPFEQDIDWYSDVGSLGQHPAAFAGEDVGVQCHHVAAGNEREPCQPRTTHAVPQVQRLKPVTANEPVHPTHLYRMKPIGLGIVLEYQHPLPTFGQDFSGQCLM